MKVRITTLVLIAAVAAVAAAPAEADGLAPRPAGAIPADHGAQPGRALRSDRGRRLPRGRDAPAPRSRRELRGGRHARGRASGARQRLAARPSVSGDRRVGPGRRLLRALVRRAERRLRPVRGDRRDDGAPVLDLLRAQLLEPPGLAVRRRLAGARRRLGGRPRRARRQADARGGGVQPALHRGAPRLGRRHEGLWDRAPDRVRGARLARELLHAGRAPVRARVRASAGSAAQPGRRERAGHVARPGSTAIELVHDQNPRWLRFPGTWGETRYIAAPAFGVPPTPFGTSPVGPAFQDDWLDPLGTIAGYPLG